MRIIGKENFSPHSVSTILGFPLNWNFASVPGGTSRIFGLDPKLNLSFPDISYDRIIVYNTLCQS